MFSEKMYMFLGKDVRLIFYLLYHKETNKTVLSC